MGEEMFNRTKLGSKMEIEFLQLKTGDGVIYKSLYSFKNWLLYTCFRHTFSSPEQVTQATNC